MMNTMGDQAAAELSGKSDLEADVDTVIAACGGSMRATIRALLIANEFLSAELERSRSCFAATNGVAAGAGTSSNLRVRCQPSNGGVGA